MFSPFYINFFQTGATALHVAAAKGYIKVIHLLIQAGVEINQQVYIILSLIIIVTLSHNVNSVP